MPIKVAQVMGPVAIAVAKEARFAEIVSAMNRFAVGAVTVIDADRRPVGVVSEDDLLLRESEPVGRRGRRSRKVSALKAGDLMTSPAVVVTPGASVREAAQLMHQHRIKQLPVIDPMTGRITGTVRQSDLLRVFDRPVGALRDEVDTVVRDTGLNPDTLSIEITEGVVTIAGRARAAGQVSRLAAAIRRIDGVVDVVCEVSAGPGEDGFEMPALH